MSKPEEMNILQALDHEPKGAPIARKEIDSAIERIKSKVTVDPTQFENKTLLAGISAHGPGTKIYTATIKGKPTEVIVCTFLLISNLTLQ